MACPTLSARPPDTSRLLPRRTCCLRLRGGGGDGGIQNAGDAAMLSVKQYRDEVSLDVFMFHLNVSIFLTLVCLHLVIWGGSLLSCVVGWISLSWYFTILM